MSESLPITFNDYIILDILDEQLNSQQLMKEYLATRNPNFLREKGIINSSDDESAQERYFDIEPEVYDDFYVN